MAKNRKRTPGLSGGQRKTRGVGEVRRPGCSCLGHAEPCHAPPPAPAGGLPCLLQSTGPPQGSHPLPGPHPPAYPAGDSGPGACRQYRGPRGRTLSPAHRHADTQGGQVGGWEEVWSPLGAICLWYQASGAAGWLTGMATGCLEIALIGSNFPCSTQGA